MKRLAALLILATACDPPAAPPAPPVPPPTSSAASTPLLDPNHPEMKKAAPAEYKVRFTTDAGEILLAVTRDWAPQGADRFYNLVRNGFYDSNRFFRVVPDFVAQFGLSGDPRISQAWRDAKIPDDPVKTTNARGTISFATSGKNSRTTQVFFNFKDNERLDKMDFSPFGRVIAGMNVVDAINREYAERPDQGRIQAEGNAYLTREFPRLSFILKAEVSE
jgi:peptidyl-prolyl cis-trans isomerase A (cyclophilin A)